MPFFILAGRPVFFAHVPRCGGSSVEDYLAARFGPLAMLDRSHGTGHDSLWCHSSPQHIRVVSLVRLFPPGFFAASFTVVRHPMRRAISVYRFNRDVARGIDPAVGFEDWLAALPEARSRERHYLDNHAHPTTELVPEGATVFRLEDGFAPLIAWLDALEGAERGGREIGSTNSYEARIEARGVPAGAEVTITPRAIELVASLYRADFERFGYDPALTA